MSESDNTNVVMVSEQRVSCFRQTNIATHVFSSFERLILAITDDDVTTFDRLSIPIAEVVKIELDGGLNVLNLAVDQERLQIIRHLAKLTANAPELRNQLV